jgi:hypothetical protein
MQQLEISFFYPLTEQISLDLDFTPSEEWIADWRKRQWNTNTLANSGSFLIATDCTGITSWSQPVTNSFNSFVIRPTEKSVGSWEITTGTFIYKPTKPNAVIRFMAKHLLGFKWHDEN